MYTANYSPTGRSIEMRKGKDPSTHSPARSTTLCHRVTSLPMASIHSTGFPWHNPNSLEKQKEISLSDWIEYSQGESQTKEISPSEYSYSLYIFIHSLNIHISFDSGTLLVLFRDFVGESEILGIAANDLPVPRFRRTPPRNSLVARRS